MCPTDHSVRTRFHNARALAVVCALAIVGTSTLAMAVAKPIGTMTIDGLTQGAVDILSLSSEATGNLESVMTLSLVKMPDASSPSMLIAVFRATPAPTAQIVIEIRRGLTVTYDLTDVVIASLDASADPKNGPIETLQLAFKKITLTVSGPGGNAVDCWDLVENKHC
jgi:type VI protein secretion system component Hcp